MTERQGIEVDYCPQCRGVWLDRGELDKIIERGEGGSVSSDSRASYPRESYDDDDHYRRPHGKRKRESFLGDLFDF